ncbi:hypothetical protein EZV62_001579 [Acer yangbiense]|uniref:Uncharacterized protein n=1 Tax=Acer yangbiense TaxID=1000413 RepID=A0A5C7IUF2_9ROSI|nr:hypothetical protein EZV62_001579 [Acer yangbiense]
MADVDPEVATAAQPTKRTFKKFSFRGKVSEGFEEETMALIKKLRKAKREAPPGEKPESSQDIKNMQEGEVVGREDDGSDLAEESEDTKKLTDRSINATIVSAAGTLVITKLLTIDQDYRQLEIVDELRRDDSSLEVSSGSHVILVDDELGVSILRLRLALIV